MVSRTDPPIAVAGDCSISSRTSSYAKAAMSQASIPLEDQESLDQTSSDGHRIEGEWQTALPPADKGLRAWLLLAGCFVINVLIWGFAFSFGVLQEYYTTHEPFASTPTGIPAIGTTATGLMYLLMPVYFFVLQRWPVLKRYSVWTSLPVLAGALIGASFSVTVPQLLVCQGILFALGGNMMYTPTVTYLDEWFVRRKGLAIGIMWAGDGVGGVVIPLILDALLSRYGFRTALRAIACAMVILMAPLLFFVKPRLPVPSASKARPVPLSFLRSPLFCTLQLFNIVQGAGFFLPPYYLPSYANLLGLQSQSGSLLLAMVNAASAIGCVLTGMLVDRSKVTNVILVISVGASAVTLAIWGTSLSLAPLLVFSLLYGLTAGSYSTTWAGMIKEVRTVDTKADANVVFGFFAAGRGIGSVISGPLSAALIAGRSHSLEGKSTLAYGGLYGPLIVFSGCTSLAGGSCWVARRLGLI